MYTVGRQQWLVLSAYRFVLTVVSLPEYGHPKGAETQTEN